MALPTDHEERMRRARLALEGLTVGDAFGDRFVLPPPGVSVLVETRTLPPSPWEHSDETQTGLALVGVLGERGAVDRDALAKALASRYEADPGRGYEPMSHWVLASIAGGLGWDEAAKSVHDGAGSRGYEAATRAAPVGAYFASDLEEVARQARASAEPTHAHADAQAAAIAVAIAAALACPMGEPGGRRSGTALLAGAIAHTPAGPTREGLEKAHVLLTDEASVTEAARALGTGAEGLAADTVPFALFCAARSIGDFAGAMWTAVSERGQSAAICAIAGAIVALAAGPGSIPSEWIEAREPLS